MCDGIHSILQVLCENWHIHTPTHTIRWNKTIRIKLEKVKKNSKITIRKCNRKAEAIIEKSMGIFNDIIIET